MNKSQSFSKYQDISQFTIDKINKLKPKGKTLDEFILELIYEKYPETDTEDDLDCVTNEEVIKFLNEYVMEDGYV